MVRTGGRTTRLVRFAVQRIDGYLSAAQLGITMASLGRGWVGEPAMAAGLVFLLITGLYILFGELVLKLLAIPDPERGALLTIVPLTALYYLSYVPVLGLRKVAAAVARLARGAGRIDEEVLSEEEIKIILEQREEQGGMSLQQLVARERGLSSALGRGAAFPHARVRSLQRASSSFCRALDAVPVRLLFLILTPYHQTASQLALLSKLARIVGNSPLRDRPQETNSVEEVREVMTVFEESVPL